MTDIWGGADLRTREVDYYQFPTSKPLVVPYDPRLSPGFFIRGPRGIDNAVSAAIYPRRYAFGTPTVLPKYGWVLRAYP